MRCKHPRPVLCLPILRQTKVIGALYLESNRMARAFTPHRRVALDILASQAAMSLENARLSAELRATEEALGKARSELARVARISSLGALSASIVHEVNQPLTGVLTNTAACVRMLETEPPDLKGARQSAHRIIRDISRASEVIARLRALFAKRAPTLEVIDLNEAAREVTALSSSELHRAGVILRQEYADPLPPVSGDRVQLQQVILNLLLNAVEAMRRVDDRPRLLLLRTQLHGTDRVSFSVRDVGVGFDPQHIDKLFEPFYTTKSDGMGIGLSVSRSIIESHHGRLSALLNDGPGATFLFAIPAAGT
jgi:C4-dicarboxylate-specific signal transduction histidine kinase